MTHFQLTGLHNQGLKSTLTNQKRILKNSMLTAWVIPESEFRVNPEHGYVWPLYKSRKK